MWGSIAAVSVVAMFFFLCLGTLVSTGQHYGWMVASFGLGGLFLIAASFSSLAFIVVRRGDNHPTSPAPTAQRSSMGTQINETLVNDIAGGGFIAQQRNAVLVGGTGTGKIHLAIAIAHPSREPQGGYRRDHGSLGSAMAGANSQERDH